MHTRRILMTTGTQAPEAHGAQRAQSTRWRLDPTRSAVAFRAKSLWGLASVKHDRVGPGQTVASR
jgi:hypothetical protein